MDTTSLWQQDSKYPQCQNLETDFGQLTLERISSDRGNWRFTKNTKPGKHNFILDKIPLYFFDEDLAEVEIERWLNIAEDYAKSDTQTDFKIYLLGDTILHGKCCIITIGKILVTNSIFSGYFANVLVPKEIEMWLSVDDQDAFPRLFISRDTAIQEMNFWIQRRGEETEFSEWVFLG